ncbi:gibberellin-regulated protein 14-like [Olea europaea var. sylvestris]|uniref:gibberellin-regulated protein 14-like n=1 Tax=Olea europaea var. sylvestris TaxID=158386 RepID=UPI000C1CCCB5|nr:gibberellin-regulated protein 14-like [Olea europaea var. sylvestris]
MAATRVILTLLLSLFCVSLASSDLKIDEGKKHHSEAFRVFSRGTDRNLMQDTAPKMITKYLDTGAPAPALAPVPPPAPTPAHGIDCGGLCKYRCSQHSRQNLCIRACGTCCVRCKCVPPGTSGNREMCGKCYTDMTTHRNKTKCP